WGAPKTNKQRDTFYKQRSIEIAKNSYPKIGFAVLANQFTTRPSNILFSLSTCCLQVEKFFLRLPHEKTAR
ncbi:MAG: hypothetical protein PVG89_08730, partial [Gammaproteobacteria bacterium]